MTWGQLRFQLQASDPGVSLDLLDEYLNTRYEQVLEATDWSGLEYTGAVMTLAAYQSSTDSVTFTLGSATVTGSGTAWTQQQLAAYRIYRPGDSVTYQPTYVSATQLTLDRPYEGLGTEGAGFVYSASPYVLMQDTYTLPADSRSVVSVNNPVNGFPLERLSKPVLAATVGPRNTVADPLTYDVDDDTPETSPPVLHTITFYPPPLYARSYAIEYLHAAAGFDGGNTSGSPLPFVSSTVLLAGARADIATYLEKPVQAAKYEAAFEKELNRMLLLEFAQKRPKARLKMAGAYTRHRTYRVTRNFTRLWGPGQGGPN